MATYETEERIEEASRSDRAAERHDQGPERGEGRRVDASLTGCLVFAAIVGLPALLYFGFFGAVLIDESVLETYWLSDVIPEPALEVLRVIYTPLLWLLDQFDG